MFKKIKSNIALLISVAVLLICIFLLFNNKKIFINFNDKIIDIMGIIISFANCLAIIAFFIIDKFRYKKQIMFDYTAYWYKTIFLEKNLELIIKYCDNIQKEINMCYEIIHKQDTEKFREELACIQEIGSEIKDKSIYILLIVDKDFSDNLSCSIDKIIDFLNENLTQKYFNSCKIDINLQFNNMKNEFLRKLFLYGQHNSYNS